MSSEHENQGQADWLEEGLKLIKNCPLCKKQYTQDTVEIIEQSEDTYLVHTTCEFCKNAVLALLVVSPLGLSSIGVITDLTAEDALAIQDKDYITQDDVLAFHEYLRHDEASFIHSLIKK